MPGQSPHSAGSSGSSMGYPANMTPTSLSGHHAGMSVGMNGVSAGHQDLRLGIPVSQQGVSWHQPSNHYTTDLANGGRSSWDFTQYLDPSPTSANMSQHYQQPPQQQQRIPSISQQLGSVYGYAPQPEWKDYPHRPAHN